MTDVAVENQNKEADLDTLQVKLTKDLETFRSQYQEVIRQSEELQKSQQNLVRQRIALEAIISYLSVKLN